MLANTLTIEDEEAVQAELAALEHDEVGLSRIAHDMLLKLRIQLEGERRDEGVVLPSVPSHVPVAMEPQGSPGIRCLMYTYIAHLYHAAEARDATPERERVPVAA